MTFNYDPIIGLNYYTDRNKMLPNITLSGVDVTESLSLEEWIEEMQKLDITLEVFNPIVSNVPYELLGERLE